jgi:anti-sigma factor RsiW
MKTDFYCRWVRPRLPLLAGGELGVEERRKVERHLIGCPDCQGRRDSSAGALAALRRLGEESPSTVDAPSLWPSLARQIRQSRHAAPRPSWWEIPLPRSWAAATLATGLGAVLAASIARPTIDRDEAAPVEPSRFVNHAPTVEAEQPEVPVVPTLASRPKPTSALPGGGLSQAPVKPIEPPSASLRFDYDLDHGTPMTPGNHDPQRTF